MKGGPGKGLLKRRDLQKSSNNRDVSQSHKSSSIREVPKPYKSSNNNDFSKPYKSSSSNVLRKGQTFFRLQDEDLPFNEPLQSFSPHIRRARRASESSLTMENEDHEDYHQEVNSSQTDTETSDPQHEENIGSTSHGATVTRKESRALSETRKKRLNKGKLIFEVDECAGRIIGEDSQRFITKGGCVMREYAKFDGTTWKKQEDTLKMDIISKCTESSNYDPTCRLMERAIQTQLANQHKNRQYRLHTCYKKFATKEEAARHPPHGINPTDWVKLCERFASEAFQKISTKNAKNRALNEVPPAVGTVSIARVVDMKRRKGEEVSAIELYKIGHFSKKKKKMVNDKAEEIWNGLQSEEADSLCTPAEICLKKLGRIPGYIKGRSASTKQILATEDLRMELELEKKRSKALEEEIQVMKDKQDKQDKFQKDQNDKIDFMMIELKRLSGLQSKKC